MTETTDENPRETKEEISNLKKEIMEIEEKRKQISSLENDMKKDGPDA